jgi:hypothetical protein
VDDATASHQVVHRSIEENFASAVGDRTYRLARENLDDMPIEISMDSLHQTRSALERLDQFVTDLQTGDLSPLEFEDTS